MLILMLMMEEDGNFYRMLRFVVLDLHCCPPLEKLPDSNRLLNLLAQLPSLDMPDVVSCCNVSRLAGDMMLVVSVDIKNSVNFGVAV